MAIELVTEEQARLLQPADALVLRESRTVIDYFFWLAFTCGKWAGLTYPLWRHYLPHNPDFPNALAVFCGLLCWLFAAFMGSDLKASRQPSNWVVIAGMNQLFIKFRSFNHWRWPAQDRVVLRLSPLDVDYVQPREGLIEERGSKRTAYKKVRFLELVLRDPLPADLVAAIQFENVHMGGSGKARSRTGHKPVRVSADSRMLSLEFGRLAPGFAEVLRLLTGRYRVLPVADIKEAPVLADTPPPLTPDRVREIEALAASGDKIGAIRMLRDYSDISLAEAKQAVEQGVERTLPRYIKRDE